MNYKQLFLKKSKKLRELIVKLLKFILNNLNHRFLALVVGALAGIGLLWIFIKYLKNDLICWFDLATNSNFIGSFQLILLGLPVFMLLWYFRTYDTKTQIKKSEEQIKKSAEQIEKSEEQSKKQINQASYFKGLDNLASNEQLKIDVGVNQLLELTKLTNYYNENIKSSFTKRLKIPIEKATTIKYTYAQYIVTWLSENFTTENLDLVGANLEGANLSDAKLGGADLSDADLSNAKLGGADLITANLEGANLSDAKLVGAKLGGVDLSNAKLVGANLGGADLSDAKLGGADLSNAKLGGADLSNAKLGGADLRGANLSETNLSGANLSKTDLRGANLGETDFTNVISLESTNFANAFYYTLPDKQPVNIDFKKLGYTLKPEDNEKIKIIKN